MRSKHIIQHHVFLNIKNIQITITETDHLIMNVVEPTILLTNPSVGSTAELINKK